jgi:hypothetical protein
LQFKLFALTALLMVAGRAISRTGEVRVAKASATTVSSQPALAVNHTIKQQFIRPGIKHLRADGHAHNHVGAFFTSTIAAFAVHPAPRYVQRVVTQMQECIQRQVSHDPDIAAATAVTAGRSPARHELLAPEGRHAVAAVASFKTNFDAVNEHFSGSESGVLIADLKFEISDPRKSKMRAR